MQCRHFIIRLASEHARADEAHLNAFLSTIQVHTVQSSLVTARGSHWSILVFYELRGAPPAHPGLDVAPPSRQSTPQPASVVCV